MSRNKQGTKVGRAERHKARERAMRERKRLRKQRAEQYAHLSGQQGREGTREPTPLKAPLRMDLESMTVGRLREVCEGHGIPTRSRDKKADLILKIDAFMEGRS